MDVRYNHLHEQKPFGACSEDGERELDTHGKGGKEVEENDGCLDG